MSNETLADIAKGDGITLGEQGEQQQAPPEQPAAPVPVDRMQVLEKPCALAWGGGCGLSAWLAEVPELAASEGEKALAGHHLANILDAVMPEHWLTDLDPNSKAGRIIVSGAVLAMLVREKSAIYDRVMAEREAQEQEAGKGEKPESDAA